MKFNEQDIDTAARTLWGECRGEPQEGQIAVAWVIRNRAERKRFAGPLAGLEGAVERVCKAKWQFSCWWDQQAAHLKALPAERLKAQADLVRGVLGGITPDPTNGADHYHTIARPGYADVWPPNWAPTMAEVARFGGHVFYDSELPPGAAAKPKRVMTSKSVVSTAVSGVTVTAIIAENVQPALDAAQQAAAAAQQAKTVAGSVKDLLGAFANGHVLTVALLTVALGCIAFFGIRYVLKMKAGDVVSK